MINENLELDEKIYFLENAESSVEIMEYVENIIYEGKENTKVRKKVENWRTDIIKIHLGKVKFVVYPMKNAEINNKVKILQTLKQIDYGEISINNRIEEFKTDLCFVIFYSHERKFNFIFEELMGKILTEIDVYKNL